VLLTIALACCMGGPRAEALPKGNGDFWKVRTRVGPDAEVPGWFLNLGITGVRALVREEAPTALEVAHVFEDTPAWQKLQVGDLIVGANGKRFRTPHRFGYGEDVFGYDGPIKDFGDALDDSQGENRGGKLVLDVRRDGRRSKVELDVGTRYGSLAEKYPFDCSKSEKILEETLAYLAEHQREDGRWHDRVHLNAFAALAMLASGEEQYAPHAEKAARYFARDTHAVDDRGKYLGWDYGLAGIVLGEYYLATEEDWVLPELEEIHAWLVSSQAPPGGWGHRAWNHPEGNGYGPICMITAQAMMALSLMQRCGIEVDEETYERTHRFLARGTGSNGYVWYEDEVARDEGWADLGRTGGAVLAHALSPSGGRAFRTYARRGARCIGEHPETFPDTHGSPILGMAWTALAAGLDRRAFRRLMDEHRWFWTLTHCPDGTFVYQPNRDNNPQDYTAAPRLSAVAMAALVFTMPGRRLQMMQPLSSR
jgi:hypothetical protein